MLSAAETEPPHRERVVVGVLTRTKPSLQQSPLSKSSKSAPELVQYSNPCVPPKHNPSLHVFAQELLCSVRFSNKPHTPVAAPCRVPAPNHPLSASPRLLQELL